MIDYLKDPPSTSRIALSAALGVVAGVVAAIFTLAQAAALIGWDMAVASYPFGVWLSIGRLDTSTAATSSGGSGSQLALTGTGYILPLLAIGALSSVIGAFGRGRSRARRLP